MHNSKPAILLILSLTVIIVLFNLSCWNQNTKIDNPAGNIEGSIISGGIERTYQAHFPSHNRSHKMPLVIALHGGGGSGEKMRGLTLNGFDALADEDGFIVIYPDGIENHWNDGRQLQEYSSHRENIDDVGFISDLIKHFVKDFYVDRKQVYVTGMSNGAMMSHRLACELSDKIAAIAPVGGSMAHNTSVQCHPSTAISVLAMNGTDDPMVPWEGGHIRFGRQKLGKVLSVSQTIEFWVSHNDCHAPPAVTWEPEQVEKDSTRVRREVYSGGTDGSEVILYAIEGSGHTWPSGYHYLSERFVSKTSHLIDANAVIWDFFKNHARK